MSRSAAGGRERCAPRPQGFSDERHGDVVVVRPMREHTLKEVAFYNRLFAVPSVFTPAVDTKVSGARATCHALREGGALEGGGCPAGGHARGEGQWGSLTFVGDALSNDRDAREQGPWLAAPQALGLVL